MVIEGASAVTSTLGLGPGLRCVSTSSAPALRNGLVGKTASEPVQRTNGGRVMKQVPSSRSESSLYRTVGLPQPSGLDGRPSVFGRDPAASTAGLDRAKQEESCVVDTIDRRSLDAGTLTNSKGSHLQPVHRRSKTESSMVIQPARPASRGADDSQSNLSAPLYDIVDCVFQLGTRGFFRRQVYAVSRQVLSLVTGTTIDEYIAAALRTLRSGSTIARWILSLQGMLWPGGQWYQNLPQYLETLVEPPSVLPSEDTGHLLRRGPLRPEDFLKPATKPPIDKDEIQEASANILLGQAPTALVHLVGKHAYIR